MDFLNLQKYGTETYHIKKYNNIYEYTKLLNNFVQEYIENIILNLYEFNNIINDTIYYLKNFKKEYQKLNDSEIQMLYYEVSRGFELIDKLYLKNYEIQDEQNIIKYVIYIYTLNQLINFYNYSLPFLKDFKEFEFKSQHSLYINLNTNEPIEEQVFYNQQELRDEIRDYFMEQLNGEIFENLLKNELSNLLMFPSTNFWLFGIYKNILKLIEEYNNLLDYLDKIDNDDYINKFENSLKKYCKFNSYYENMLQFYKDYDFNHFRYFKDFILNPLKNMIFYTMYINSLIPKNFFAEFEMELLKNPLDAAQFILSEFLDLLQLAINTENTFDLYFQLKFFDLIEINILKKFEEIEKLLDESQCKCDFKNYKNNGLDLLACQITIDLIENNITKDKISKVSCLTYDNVKTILNELNLIDDLDKELYLIKNGIIDNKNIKLKLKNYIKSNFLKNKCIFQLSEYFTKLGTLPIEKKSIVPENGNQIDPVNNLLEEVEKPGDNIEVPTNIKNKIQNELQNKNKNNTIPKMNKDLLLPIAQQQTLFMQNLSEKMQNLQKLTPILNSNPTDSLKNSLKDLQNIQKINQKDILDSLNNTKIDLNKKLNIKNNIAINTDKFVIPKEINKSDIINNINQLNTIEIPQSDTNIIENFSNSLKSNMNNSNIITMLNEKANELNDKINTFWNKKIKGKIEEFRYKIEEKINLINNKIGIINEKINKFLNSISGFINKYADKLKNILTKINNFISALMCAFKALLCLLFSILNLFDVNSEQNILKKLKNELKNEIDSFMTTLELFLDNANTVIDDLLKTFGFDISKLCKSDSATYANSLKAGLEKEMNDLVNSFMNNVEQIIKQSKNCSFIMSNLALLNFKKFNFGFEPILPPRNLFIIPNC